ncbi:MAG: LysR family transcriptional regulator, partial [Rhodobacteraceae bacterium]|nr:LysR family transcriptional regulator [Paracoccaceae bacterium]
MATKLDWDALRHVLAIARSGSLAGAARALRMRHSSVYRRLNQIEAQLGVRLFDRLRTGYRLTEHGEVMQDAAARMEQSLQDAERLVAGADLKLSGEIRISTSEIIGLYLLPRHLRTFRDAHPGITLDISVTDNLADLSKRDADIVIRGTDAPPE